MNAYYLRNTPSGLEVALRELPVPSPKVGERLIRVHAASLNRGELLGATSDWKPAGAELAGEDVTTGERWMGRCRGGFAQYALLDDREALPIPSSLSFEQAAAVPLTFLVAYDMLIEQGRLRAAEWLLIVGASSGVGVASLRMGKLLGAQVAVTSSSERKLDRLTSLGADVVLPTQSFASSLRERTGGHGADLIVNAVGGSQAAACLSSLAYQGRLAIVGSVDGVLSAQLDLGSVHEQRLQIFGVSNRLRSATAKAETVAGFRRDVLPALFDGRLTPVIDQVFPMSELAEAIAVMQRGQHVGKLVVRW